MKRTDLTVPVNLVTNLQSPHPQPVPMSAMESFAHNVVNVWSAMITEAFVIVRPALVRQRAILPVAIISAQMLTAVVLEIVQLVWRMKRSAIVSRVISQRKGTLPNVYRYAEMSLVVGTVHVPLAIAIWLTVFATLVIAQRSSIAF